MDEHLTVPGGSNSQLNSLDQNRNEYVRIMEEGQKTGASSKHINTG